MANFLIVQSTMINGGYLSKRKTSVKFVFLNLAGIMVTPKVILIFMKRMHSFIIVYFVR